VKSQKDLFNRSERNDIGVVCGSFHSCSMDLEPHVLKKFLAIVDELNFNRAAERLHVSQPALSQAIRRLEAELGKNVFERDSHGVQLTDFGRTFAAIARGLVAQHDRAVANALEAARGEHRSFRMGYSLFVDLTVVTAVRTEFAKEEPDTRIEVRGIPGTDQVALLTAGALDAGLLASPFIAQNLNSEILNQEPFMIGLMWGHRLAHQPVLSLHDVEEEPLIWLPRNFNPTLVDWFFSACAARGYAPRIAQEATTLPELLEFVAQGLGITLLPRSATILTHPGVVFRELAGGHLSLEVVVAYRQDNDSEILKRFVTFTKHRFRRDR
jgi:DNA-binding transcriptional LysR family regulator